ncbi:MAG: hypothetical protein IT222_12055 [Crocinitomix sp.]|nr:hypothetical protein [Crocinitomix sp.]
MDKLIKVHPTSYLLTLLLTPLYCGKFVWLHFFLRAEGGISLSSSVSFEGGVENEVSKVSRAEGELSLSLEAAEKEKENEKWQCEFLGVLGNWDTNKMGGIEQSLIFNYLCLVCSTNFGDSMHFWGISSFG